MKQYVILIDKLDRMALYVDGLLWKANSDTHKERALRLLDLMKMSTYSMDDIFISDLEEGDTVFEPALADMNNSYGGWSLDDTEYTVVVNRTYRTAVNELDFLLKYELDINEEDESKIKWQDDNNSDGYYYSIASLRELLDNVGDEANYISIDVNIDHIGYEFVFYQIHKESKKTR